MARERTQKKAAATSYIVLEQVQVADGKAWRPVSNGDGPEPKVFEASGKPAAIRLHTGEGSEASEGTFKAVSVAAWKGGVTNRRVQQTERLPLEEGLAS